MTQDICETTAETAVAEAMEKAVDAVGEVETTVEAAETETAVEAAGTVKEAETAMEAAETEAAETVKETETAVEAAETEAAVEAAKTEKEAETAMEAAETETAVEAAETEEKADRETAKAEKSPIYRRAYLIDSENISDEWVDLLDTMEGQDAIFVFYTGKSTHINCERVYKLMQYGIGRVQWIKCFEGSNALDFQLVTELGAMIGLGKAVEYIIVSKDNGYNPVVKYWNDRGITVSKKGAKTDKKTEEPMGATPGSGTTTEKALPEKTEIPSPEKLPLPDSAKAVSVKGFLGEILKSVDIMDNTLLYAVLTAFEGQAAGAEAYRQLRDLPKEEKAVLRELLLEDKYKRGVNYVRIIVQRNEWVADDVDELYDTILKSSKKNKDKYHKALVEKFGKESGENYYNMTKSHYNYVKKV